MLQWRANPLNALQVEYSSAIILLVTLLSFGLMLGYATTFALINKDANSAYSSGWKLLILSVLTVFVTRPDWFDILSSLSLSFLWALSLIAIGSIVRAPKNQVL